MALLCLTIKKGGHNNETTFYPRPYGRRNRHIYAEDGHCRAALADSDICEYGGSDNRHCRKSQDR